MRAIPIKDRRLIKSFQSGTLPERMVVPYAFARNAEGLTDLVNAENQSYQTLKRFGLVANPNCAYK